MEVLGNTEDFGFDLGNLGGELPLPGGSSIFQIGK